MALLSPSQIHSALKEVQRTKPANPDDPVNLKELLVKNNLTPDEVLDNLSSQMRTAETPATRLRAAEVALRLNGLLDSDTTKPDFHVTINIIDNEFSGTNPILIPR
jgi:hypothetical protein